MSSDGYLHLDCIIRRPRALLLHFKRFIVDISPDFTCISYRKDHSPVIFPETMSLPSSRNMMLQEGKVAPKEESKKNSVVGLDRLFLTENVSVPAKRQDALHGGGVVCGNVMSANKSKGSPTVDLSQKKNSSELPRKYRLKSVVHHIGSSANCGHYTADAQRSGEWMRFNDRVVSRKEAKDVTGEAALKTAYMVLYELE
uniref:USP domain-containing protein n=1 Tax=Odontella aurita TaxID=265563 RepID=A0A7S4ILU3_9STRA|mmetsp:Transcript_26929/g.79584  ORF Transcript_26929/g.79584 Transcript_26929/m.79584 type:complete len:199 (+) Transcript_26929:76-672(+)